MPFVLFSSGSFGVFCVFIYSMNQPQPQPQRYQYVDRISTVIDDYTHRSKSLSVAGWGCPRVNVNMAELRAQGNGGLSQRLRRDPLPHIRALEAACHEIAMEARPGYDKNGTNEDIVWVAFLLACLIERFAVLYRAVSRCLCPLC